MRTVYALAPWEYPGADFDPNPHAFTRHIFAGRERELWLKMRGGMIAYSPKFLSSIPILQMIKIAESLTFCGLLLGSSTSAVYAQPDRALTPEETRHWPTLKRGEARSSPLVIAVKYLLRSHGHRVKIDENYNNQTAWEIKRFQHKHHLNETGNIGEPTWEVLAIPLGVGDTGDAVRAVQNRLRRNGYEIEVTGRFDVSTKKAVALFQSSKGNAYVNGRVDARTWCFLVNGTVVP